jgi:hypothetical protein
MADSATPGLNLTTQFAHRRHAPALTLWPVGGMQSDNGGLTIRAAEKSEDAKKLLSKLLTALTMQF